MYKNHPTFYIMNDTDFYSDIKINLNTEFDIARLSGSYMSHSTKMKEFGGKIVKK